MNILHINSYYSGSRFYKNLFDNQIMNGLNINVFVPVSYSFNFTNLSLGDYTKVSINHKKYERFLFHLKHKKIYKDILKKYKIQDYAIIHAHSLFSNGFIAMKLKREFKVPYVVAVRNTDVHTFFKYMPHLRKIGIKILRDAEKIVFLSESYKNTVVNKYIPSQLKYDILDKSHIIPNGIDGFWFKNIGNTKTRPKKQDLKLIYVGNINKNKNLLTTIRAIEILQDSGYKVRYTVVGKVSDEFIYNKLKALSYVNYIEPIPKEDLIMIYRQNDIFVMPSIHETFGLVYPEAMSQGLPLIYSKGQGFDAQFDEGQVGYNVEPLNPSDIAEKIIKIIENYNNISNFCLDNVNNFSWHKITDEYLKVYKEVIKTRKID